MMGNVSGIDEIWIGLLALAVSSWVISAAKPRPQRGVLRDSLQLAGFLIAVMLGFGLIDEFLRQVVKY